jgi:hypothetical protein
MGDKLQKWLESGKYLPVFMRDFHDQKDLFKCIHSMTDYSNRKDSISWVHGHIYVIDAFLWFMARRGYTLQKNRTKQDFVCLSEDIATLKERRGDSLQKFMIHPRKMG